jgi:hypothetical protein
MRMFCGNLVNNPGWKCVGQYQRWHSLIHIYNQFKLVGNLNAYFWRFSLSLWNVSLLILEFPIVYTCIII